MRNLALIFGFVIALFSDAGAMQTENLGNNLKGIPVILYKVNVQPPVEVLQVRSKNIVQLGGIISKAINISCKEYNGIPMQGPIDITYDMTKEELGQSLCRAFGVESVNYFEGVMPKNFFERRFSFFLKNQ